MSFTKIYCLEQTLTDGGGANWGVELDGAASACSASLGV